MAPRPRARAVCAGSARRRRDRRTPRRAARAQPPSSLVLAPLQHVADDVARPVPHLVIDAADVLADQPDPEQGHANQEEGDREQREHAFGLGTDYQPAHREERDEKPVMRSKLSRISRNNEYFDTPAPRSSCATRISVGLIAKV